MAESIKEQDGKHFQPPGWSENHINAIEVGIPTNSNGINRNFGASRRMEVSEK